MIAKYLLRGDRQRQIPPSFSWVDHRLIRHLHLSQCDHSAWALYLFLVPSPWAPPIGACLSS